MFDGVDEISGSNRHQFWKCISEIWDKVPRSHIVITSRNIHTCHLSSGAYRDDIYTSQDAFAAAARQWRPPVGFLEFIVAPLSIDEIIHFVDLWFTGVDERLLPPSQGQDIKTFPKRLKSDLFLPQNRGVLELSRTPLLCTLVCMVFFLSRGRLPKNKRRLYAVSTQLLVETRDEYREIPVPIEFSGLTPEKRLAMLQFVALSMQEGIDPHVSEQSIEVDREIVLEWIQTWCQNNGVTSPTADKVLGFVVERCSLLREPANNRIDFIHRSFMEYLAANEVVLTRTPFSLRPRIKDDQWFSTLQFCMETERGAYFAGALAEQVIKYLFHSRRKDPPARIYLLRVAAYFRIVGRYLRRSEVKLGSLQRCFCRRRSLSEAKDCTGIPFECLREWLEFARISELHSDRVYLAAVLLSEHEDERCSEIITTGYERYGDMAVIEVLNRSGRVPVSKHFALLRRLDNESYKRKVFFDANELNDVSVRELATRKIGIRFRNHV